MQTRECYKAWIERTGCSEEDYTLVWFVKTAEHYPAWNDSDSATAVGVRMFVAGWRSKERQTTDELENEQYRREVSEKLLDEICAKSLEKDKIIERLSAELRESKGFNQGGQL